MGELKNEIKNEYEISDEMLESFCAKALQEVLKIRDVPTLLENNICEYIDDNRKIRKIKLSQKNMEKCVRLTHTFLENFKNEQEFLKIKEYFQNVGEAEWYIDGSEAVHISKSTKIRNLFSGVAPSILQPYKKYKLKTDVKNTKKGIVATPIIDTTTINMIARQAIKKAVLVKHKNITIWSKNKALFVVCKKGFLREAAKEELSILIKNYLKSKIIFV